jgi:lactate permease
MLEIWPAILVAGVCFAVPQYLISNFHGPWLVDVVAAIISLGALALFMRVWHPKRVWRFPGEDSAANRGLDDEQESGSQSTSSASKNSAIRNSGSPDGQPGWGASSKSEIFRAWVPWIILSLVVFAWGLPQTKALLDGFSAPKIPVLGLDKLVLRVPPIVPKPTAEAAVFNFNWLSATGSGILLASVIAGLVMGFSIRGLLRVYWETLKLVRFSLLTIAAMLAIGFTTRYSGLDATLGLAFAKTGFLYPFFGTMLGWLGVALTGSDTSSNVLFGSLQKITALQLGLSPVLMAAANSSGGVMGKMIDAQSIVVASTATRWYGHEGEILRYVFFHSLALAALVGILVLLQAYVFTFMVVP